MSVCHDAGASRRSCILDSSHVQRQCSSLSLCTTAMLAVPLSEAGRSAPLQKASLQVASASSVWQEHRRRNFWPMGHTIRLHHRHASWRSSGSELESLGHIAGAPQAASDRIPRTCSLEATLIRVGLRIASQHSQSHYKHHWRVNGNNIRRGQVNALNGCHPVTLLDDASTTSAALLTLSFPPVRRLCRCLAASETHHDAVAGDMRHAGASRRCQQGGGGHSAMRRKGGTRSDSNSSRWYAAGGECEADSVTFNGSSSPRDAQQPCMALPLPPSTPTGSPSSSGSSHASGSASASSASVRVWGVELPLQSLAAWALVAAGAWVLRPFAGIVLGTFLLCFLSTAITESAMRFLPPLLRRRKLLLSLFYALLLTPPCAFLALNVPHLPHLTATISAHLQDSSLFQAVDALQLYLGPLAIAAESPAAPTAGVTAHASTLSSMLLPLLRSKLQQVLSQAATVVPAMAATLSAAVASFLLQSLLSLILSFLIVWDLPAVSAFIVSLRASRLAFLLHEVSPAASEFAQVFGRAMTAQALVAVVNTGLTLLCLLLLGMQRGLLLLSAVVFVCSFVPVAGVVLSSVPIGAVALVEGGFMKVAMVVVLILFVHAVEAYILNPLIYSSQLKLHPAATLAVLVVAEHSFGVWGLIVAVPCTAFILRNALQPNQQLHSPSPLPHVSPA